MPINSLQESILALLFDGHSMDQIADLTELPTDTVLVELATALEAIRVHTIDDALHLIGEHGTELLTATRH